MKEITGEAPEISVVVDEITKLRNLLKGVDVDVGKQEKPVKKSKKKVSAEQPKEETEESVPVVPTQDIAVETIPLSSDPDEPDEKEIEDPDLLGDFIGEATEHLESIELNMVEWEKNPTDKEIINSIFRPFHTIKGVAGFLNIQKINQLSHNLENLLDEAREDKIKLSNDLSDLIFDGVDLLKSMIGTLELYLEKNEPIKYKVNIEAFIHRLSMFLNVASVTGDDDDDWMEDEKPPPTPVGEILVKDGKMKEDDLKKSLEKQANSGGQKKLGEILVKDKTVTARDIRDAIRKQAEPSKRIEKHIKVDTSKMDQLLDIVGELVISQSMVTENPKVLKIPDQRLSRDLSQLQRVTSTLQSISMSMRLVPIGATFQKMNRIVRDLARKSGKKINLVLEGQNAEIDRNMVEELYDPLVHMVRNSCDHGIQTPDFRAKSGKSEEGTILLKAEHAGGRIVISISDLSLKEISMII